MDSSTHGSAGDADWQRRVEIVIAPDPRLSAEQREVVERDYGMRSGRLRLKTRATLVEYLLRLLQLDPRQHDANPLAQQIVLANAAALRPHLFATPAEGTVA